MATYDSLDPTEEDFDDDLSLDPTDRLWLIRAGASEESLDIVPVSTLRELYGDVFQYGPNAAVVKEWMAFSLAQADTVQSASDIFWQFEDETFKAFAVKASAMWSDHSSMIKNEEEFLSWYSLKHQAEIFADKLGFKVSLRIFPLGTSNPVLDQFEREARSVIALSMMALLYAGFYPEGSKVEKLRKLVVFKLCSLAGMDTA